MRPTVFGKQIVSRNGVLCGVNIGYNFYNEHEHGVGTTLKRINDLSIEIRNLSEKISFETKKKNAMKKAESFRGTPFSNCIILPNIDYIRREIIIDNSDLKKTGKCINFMLEDTNYTLFIFSDYNMLNHYREKLGQNRKFNEAQFLYMGDYNIDYSTNFGAQLAGVSSCNSKIGVGTMSTMISGAWGSDGFLVLIRRTELTDGLADTIENNLKNGGLALVEGPCGLFRDRGLSLVFLNNIYNNGQENKPRGFKLW